MVEVKSDFEVSDTEISTQGEPLRVMRDITLAMSTIVRYAKDNYSKDVVDDIIKTALEVSDELGIEMEEKA